MDKNIKKNFIVSAVFSILYLFCGIYFNMYIASYEKGLDAEYIKVSEIGSSTVSGWAKLFGTAAVGLGKLLIPFAYLLFVKIPAALGTFMLFTSLLALVISKLQLPYRLLMTIVYIIMGFSGTAYFMMCMNFRSATGIISTLFAGVTPVAAVYGMGLTYSKRSIKMNGKIKEYISSLEIDSVPWYRMATAYGSAENYPEALNTLDKMQNIDEVKQAWYTVSDFEHQDTMFPPAPFALVFLERIFEKSINSKGGEAADWLLEKLLSAFSEYIWTCEYADGLKHSKPLSDFSDMLDEKYLLPEEYDDDDLEEFFADENFLPDDLFYSIYYYSKIVLLNLTDILNKYDDDRFENLKEQLKKLD